MNLETLVRQYAIASDGLGKSPKEVVGFRFVSGPACMKDRIVFTCHVLIENRYVKYVREVRVQLRDSLPPKFSSRASRTRLVVPLKKVPMSADIYFTNDHLHSWAIRVRESKHGAVWLNGTDGQTCGPIVVGEKEEVEVTLYFSTDGLCIGDALCVSEEEMLSAGIEPRTLQNSCKFDVLDWAIEYMKERDVF